VVLSDLHGNEQMAEGAQRLTRVRERTHGMMDLISDLLDISRIELGVQERSLEEVNPLEMLSRTAEMFGPKAQEKALALEINIAEEPEPKPMLVDPRELESIYVNLLTNAIKYTPEGGMISILGAIENGRLTVAFQDTGIGIAEDDLKRIFQKFYRVKSQDTRMIVGTGLGLPIVKSIVDANNGNIDIESSLGEGTTITVQLPLTH